MSDNDHALELFAKIGVTLDAINARGKRMETSWLQRATDTPRDVLVRFSGICPTPTAAFTLAPMEVGGVGPQEGEVWILRMCRIGGVTPTTTAAGRADLYQSPVDPTYGGAAGNTASWVDQATSLPLVGSYSSRYVVLRAPDKLWIVVTNGTADQQYVANAQFEVYADSGYRPTVEL